MGKNKHPDDVTYKGIMSEGIDGLLKPEEHYLPPDNEFFSYYYIDDNRLLRYVTHDNRHNYLLDDNGKLIVFHEDAVIVCTTDEEYQAFVNDEQSEKAVCVTTFTMTEADFQHYLTLRDDLNGGTHH